MASQRRGAGSSEETSPESTAVVLSKTTFEAQRTSGSAGGAACPSSTPTGRPSFDGDWHRSFQLLSACLGREMISGDLVALVAMNLASVAGEEPAKEFLRCLRMNRSSFTDSFMG
jgi:hypothetical protein